VFLELELELIGIGKRIERVGIGIN